MNMKLTDRASVKQVLTELTLEEKARLLSGATSFGTAAVPRLGIPAATLLDGGSGVNLRQYLSNLLTGSRLTNETIVSRFGGATGNGILSELVFILDHLDHPEQLNEAERELLEDFLAYLKEHTGVSELPSAMPVNTLLAASWNPEVVYECGRVVGREACALGVDVLLGSPCVNIQRDPLGGRGFEGYSEDPCLTAKLAPQFVKGVQESGVLANVKHFAANNQETNRKTINECISERALHEIYFPAFKACVQEGAVGTVMTAYNWINGEACAHNQWLIKEILRENWGFEGLVVSDWGGVYDRVKGIAAETDLTMPISDERPLIDAVRQGALSLEQLDRCTEHYLNALVEMPVMKGRKYRSIDAQAAKKTAYQAASEGIVLLKNNRETLPLERHIKVLLAGEQTRWKETGVGSGRVHTDKTSSIKERLAELLGDGQVLTGWPDERCDAVIVTVSAAGQEGMDRDRLTLKEDQQTLLKRAMKKAKSDNSRLILILNVAGPVELADYADDVDAILCVYFPGQEGGRAAADILCGKVNPSGKLPHTFPRSYVDTPSFGNFPGEDKKVMYGEGIFVGYRYYDTKGVEVQYPFGYGLSYTAFRLADLRLAEKNVNLEQEPAKITVRLSNVGNRDGKEVVQLYVHDIRSTLIKPKKELKSFQKVFLKAGESTDITFLLKKEDFSSYDASLHKWTCEPGEYELLIGTSSRDIALQEILSVTCRNEYGYGAMTDYRTLIEDDRSLDILFRNLPDGCFTKEEMRRAVEVYYPQTVTFREAFPIYLGIRLKRLCKEEQEQIFCSMVRDLECLEPEIYKEIYRETEIY